MRWKETLYRRPLQRPLDDPTREAISNEFSRRRDEIPIATELQWDETKPQFTIRSKLLSFIVQFTPEEMIVDAELGLAAKMLATQENRKQAVDFIDSIARDLNL
jgi:hypothetical protein